MSIVAEGLCKFYGRTAALNGVSLKVPQGGFLAVFGPNGAGKTTLIRVLSTLSKSSKGRVLIEGYDVQKEGERVRGKLGVISHETFLYDDLTAVENLMFYGRMYGLEDLKTRVSKALHEVGLGARVRDRVGTFSRGMKQRLSIARADLHDPPIMFLDEPYAGLDQQAIEMLTGMLGRLKNRGKTIVMTTHNLEMGRAMSDQILLLDRGTVVYRSDTPSIDLEGLRTAYRMYVGGKRR